MRAVAIGVVELRRLVRDRTNVFLLFVFPIVLILLIGASSGGSSTPRVGAVVEDGGRFAARLVARLRADDSIEMEQVSGRDELLDDVERGALDAGVVIGRGYTRTLAFGGEAAVEYVARPGDFGTAIRAAVDAAVADEAALVEAARVAASRTGRSFADSVALADRAAASLPESDVAFYVAGETVESADDDGFGEGAATQLTLFVFVNSLTGSVALVRTRRYGVLARMLATSTAPGTIVVGETIGRFLVAALQGVFIIGAASLLFGVGWGDPVGAAVVLLLFALVGTGAATLFGSVAGDERQARALMPFGLAVAALGGSMVPLEVFPGAMRALAHVTPHAWANEAFAQLRLHGAGLGDVVPQVAALAAFAAVLMLGGTFLLRRELAA